MMYIYTYIYLDMGLFTEHDGQDASPVPPLRSEDVTKTLIGQMKGIQGHCNSCYMDAALFRLGHASVLEQ